MSKRLLTVVQMNDLHGYLEPHAEIIWSPSGPQFPTMGGLARIASVVASLREETAGALVFLDNGDTFHGTFPAVQSKGEALIPMLNALGIDAMTAHWDFAWGPGHLRSLTSQLNYPMLAANCTDPSTGERPFSAQMIFERGGIRVAVIGLAATIIDKSMPPRFAGGLQFTSGISELPSAIEQAKKDAADIVVVLSHQGFPQDCLLAESVAGIDIIVSGHTHNRLSHPARVGQTLIMQSGCHGSFIGKMTVSIDDGRIDLVEHQLIPIDETIPEHADIAELVERAMAPHRAILSEIVGSTTKPLHRATSMDAPMDDFLLAAICDVAGTAIGFSNGWRYGAPIPPGPISQNDLWNIIPTNPAVSTVELTGAEIWEMVEDNLERTFSADPFGQMGGYVKRFRGLTVFGRIENPPGHRVVDIHAGQEVLDAKKLYRVAYVTEQAVPAKFGVDRANLEMSAIDAMASYLRKDVLNDIAGTGRFVAV